jgi:hypothetical protein
MLVEFAAVRGKRIRADGSEHPDYLEVRTTVTLDAVEWTVVKLTAGFRPDSLVVDPGAKDLRLRRKEAVAAF